MIATIFLPSIVCLLGCKSSIRITPWSVFTGVPAGKHVFDAGAGAGEGAAVSVGRVPVYGTFVEIQKNSWLKIVDKASFTCCNVCASP